MIPAVVVAIDGPSASGKSTVARRVAERLPDFVYVDSGALYRLVTVAAMQAGVAPEDGPVVRRFLDALPLEYIVRDRVVVYRVGGREAGPELRTQAVNENVSLFAALAPVRERVVGWLRGLTRFGSLVMEGRDIGEVVFPGAACKFYLNASPEERARRRHRELEGRVAPDDGGLRQVDESLRRRDRIDSGRAVAPLRIPAGSAVIDSTGLTIDQVVEVVLSQVRRVPGLVSNG